MKTQCYLFISLKANIITIFITTDDHDTLIMHSSLIRG